MFIQKNIPLAPFTTFKVGGPAKFFIQVQNKIELINALKWAENNKKQIFILGGGSNVIINDNGINGLVIKINNKNIKVDKEIVRCGAGTSLAEIINAGFNNNLSGIEWAIGIPMATIGGAVRGNAGAFGSLISDIVERIEVLDMQTKKFVFFKNKDCEFSYRESIFKNNKNYLIWSCVLKMQKSKKSEINAKLSKYLKIRKEKQETMPSAGCIFKNLKISNLYELNANLANKAIKEGSVKCEMVGTRWLIDLMGLKGTIIGGAQISLEHANFIINTGNASAKDIIKLINYIKKQAKIKFNVRLEEEIQYLT
ncbi:MAG: UDP-N-acetylmuramate dehydrogenase [Patescibacteria group bacterium]|nr:UDP-N-acetylmuramate dehydrogenase [Patescibacteria group bacterium]MBU1160716.1 UDP-N-acetylmuramate dehydrogenase [Patescibacteria group bacterium]MBU1987162.1 UDP-N-acetylmuramate dehydrogenase [Patescibacteria group bacterium]MBU2415835.1 UDP-N-acetylmuramate dehydrogenase [Patescibacteria group bacterium]MBU2474489.1 UDP-N-acetylmuramate dehydrogenase [Patescibacteria group bacterium]